MKQPHMLTRVDPELLAEAFPEAMRESAIEAGGRIAARLHARQWTDRFDVLVGSETVSIPHRLHFWSGWPAGGEAGAPRLAGKCLETRSNDGFHRQRAVRELLADVRPWSAPFVTALIGEYVVEILHDIHDALGPGVGDVLAGFIAANPLYWRLTRARVTSYWDAYYRRESGRSDYVGFRLVEALEEAVRSRAAADASAG